MAATVAAAAVPAAATPRWTPQLINKLRQTGDPLADTTIELIFNIDGLERVEQILGTLILNDDVLFAKKVPPFSHPAANVLFWYMVLAAVPPAWANPIVIRQGEAVYSEYGVLGFPILGCASLPEAYATLDASAVLGSTQQLELHIKRRLYETTQFVIDVMSADGLSSAGRGIATALKVRLMHASIRHLILHQAPPAAAAVQPSSLAQAFTNMDWPRKELGIPVHQVAMSMAVLSFSFVVLRSLKKLGVDLDSDSERAYLHCWNVIGHYMGVDERLLLTRPETMEEAQELYELVWPPAIRPTPEGRALEKTLLDYLASFVPAAAAPLRHLPKILTRHLLSDEICAAIDVQLDWGESIGLEILKTLTGFHQLGRRIVGEIGLEFPFAERTLAQLLSCLAGLPHLSDKSLGQMPATRIAAEWLFRQMAKGLQYLQRGKDRRPFEIPQDLAKPWRLDQ